MYIFLILIGITFLYDIGILVALIVEADGETPILTLITIEVILSSLLNYMGT